MDSREAREEAAFLDLMAKLVALDRNMRVEKIIGRADSPSRRVVFRFTWGPGHGHQHVEPVNVDSMLSGEFDAGAWCARTLDRVKAAHLQTLT
ncbi:hypothetical protein ACG04Q_11995 [Roseateles sp. DXS20W]|uniref:Uncharacterized protein n=1 Tax=Pelomonas lactea TaxID=3299030 RepID=A0ABW7GK36_9BURK